MNTSRLSTPAGYVPLYGVGFVHPDGDVNAVSTVNPMPVATVAPDTATAPALVGDAVGDTLEGPFAPIVGVPCTLVLAGVWTGTATVMRSTDGGATIHPLTAAGQPWGRFSANACEQVWQEDDDSARLYLSIKLASGQLSYRLGH